MRRLVPAIVASVLIGQTVMFAVDSKKAAYVGGTIASLAANVEGRLNTSEEEVVTFIPDSNARMVTIPYKAITSLEYGQKAGRRVGVAILISPLALSRKSVSISSRLPTRRTANRRRESLNSARMSSAPRSR